MRCYISQSRMRGRGIEKIIFSIMYILQRCGVSRVSRDNNARCDQFFPRISVFTKQSQVQNHVEIEYRDFPVLTISLAA